ncbi:MAG: hypothetical protein D6799_00740 [Bacteroidetes bacterium]|nr:MAG: hypothetical protein D6799_00740 [Bacteroidota bacterium]
MIFINKRYVKNNYLSHAVYEAFKNLIPPDHHPSFFLFFTIDPSRIDWNVHPAKIEARLLDEKIIYPFLVSVIKKGIGVSGITHNIEFSTPPDIDMRDIDPHKTAPPPQIKIDPHYNPFKTNTASSVSKPDPASWEEYYKIFQEAPSHYHPPVQSDIEFSENKKHAFEYIECFQWMNKYIVCHLSENLLIIDQHRAHEKIIYEKIKTTHPSLSSQFVLFPIHIDLSPNDFLLLKELIPLFKEHGIDVEEFGNNSVVVNAYPSFMNEKEMKSIIENTLENFRINQIAEIKDIKENFYRSIAKSTAVKYGQILTKPEMLKIIEELFSLNEYTYSPAGKKIFKEIEHNDISSYFKK